MRLLKDINYKKMITNRITVTAIMILLELALLLGIFWRAVQYSWFIMGAFSLLSMLYVFYLVIKDDNASYRIGWILLIAFIPPFGAFLYMLWGDKKPSKKLQARLNFSYLAMDKYLEDNEETCKALAEVSHRAVATARYIKKTSRYPVHRNTHVTYYSIGEAMFEAMLEDMRKAEHFIFLEFFIVQEGEMWGRMLEVLLEKAREGVEIRMLYDDMGSVALLPFGYSDKLEEMDPHIKCIPFNPVVPFLAMVMNNRDHRKILVVDGHIGYTGGVNLSDEYINAVQRFGHWKDTGVRLAGDGVWNLTVMFMEMWNACSEFKLSPELYGVDAYPHQKPEVREGFVQPYGDDPLDDERVGEDVYLEILHQAKKYVYIMTPYLILDDEMKHALVMAAKRGVDVRIVTPGIPDKKIVFRLTRANYLPLLEAGVKIYEYTPGFVHAKSFICDDTVGVVGTINLDYRSLYLHFECAVWMYRVPALEDLKRDTLETIEKSQMVYREDVHTSGLKAMFDGLLRVMAPLL
ncbi:MAG: cardiolipin synthase [Lachnospiraceae bacterium]|nr:cardiolipin synthase [Lachnospiraceae bacterium]